MFNPNRKDARAIFRQLLAKMESGEMECVSLEIEFKPINDTFRIVGEVAPQRLNRSRSVTVNMDVRDYTSPSEMSEIMEGDPIEQVASSVSYPGAGGGSGDVIMVGGASSSVSGYPMEQIKILADGVAFVSRKTDMGQYAAENTTAKDKKKSANAAAKAKELATAKARMKAGAIPPRDIIFEDEPNDKT